MKSRLINTLTWLLVAGSVAILLGGLLGRPVLVAAVPTTSMVPVLHPGDLIPIVPRWGSAPEVGEIIVFKTSQDASWIVHRVVSGNSQTGYVTRGDANAVADPNPVFLGDIAGYVPTIGGTALHIPGLGSLSLGRTPLGNPLVAGTALTIGVFLLVNDVGSELFRIRWRRLFRRRSLTKERNDTLFIYVALAALAFVATTVTTLSLSTEQTAKFTVVHSKSVNVTDPRLSVLGSSQRDTVRLQNPSYVPVIVGLSSDDPDIRWEEDWVFVGPVTHRDVGLTRLSQVPGEHTAKLRQAIYLPLLPPLLIRFLARLNWSLPIYATALVPVLIVMGAAWFDRRARLQWHRLRLALHLRYWA